MLLGIRARETYRGHGGYEIGESLKEGFQIFPPNIRVPRRVPAVAHRGGGWLPAGSRYGSAMVGRRFVANARKFRLPQGMVPLLRSLGQAFKPAFSSRHGPPITGFGRGGRGEVALAL